MNEHTFWRSLGVGVGAAVSFSLILTFLGNRDDRGDTVSGVDLVSLAAPNSIGKPNIVAAEMQSHRSAPTSQVTVRAADEFLEREQWESGKPPVDSIAILSQTDSKSLRTRASDIGGYPESNETRTYDSLELLDLADLALPGETAADVHSQPTRNPTGATGSQPQPQMLELDSSVEKRSGDALSTRDGAESIQPRAIQPAATAMSQVNQINLANSTAAPSNPFFHTSDQNRLSDQSQRDTGGVSNSRGDRENSDSSNQRLEPSWHDLELGLGSNQPMVRSVVERSNSELNQTDIHHVVAAVTAGLLNLPLNDAVAVQAAQRIEYGKTLARRGAFATAQQEFQAALSILAQDFDAQSQSSRYSQSLSRGLIALQEAEDFLRQDTAAQFGYQVAELMETHQSRVFDRNSADQISMAQALQAYLGFSQQQLEAGVGHNPVSAEALYCLGKLNTNLPHGASTDSKVNVARAIVFHRAATAADSRNYRSANELGVLLANLGELNESKEWLKHSLKVRSTAKAWENLAKVHQRLNEPQLAQLALGEYQQALQQISGGTIQWMDTPQFKAHSPQPPFSDQAVGVVAGNQRADLPTDKDHSSPNKFGWGNRLKSLY